MFVLDTNAVSDLRKAMPGKANPGLVQWAEATPALHMYMSVISLHDLQHGILLLEPRGAQQGLVLRRWLEGRVMPAFDNRILSLNPTIARRAAMLHVPGPAKRPGRSRIALVKAP